MEKESVLILGGGIMQIPAINAAKELGYYVFVADANKHAPGIYLADAFLNIDLINKEKLALEAEKLKASNNLVGVFTAGTDFSTSVAYIAEKTGLPGIKHSVAQKASNKKLMRKAFFDASVPSPVFITVTNAEEAIAKGLTMDFPIVIKPVDSMGARGVIKIESPKDSSAIAKATEKALAVSKTSEAIIEEFIDGPEFSLDAIVCNGEITICGFADRHIFFPPYFIEMGHTMPSIVDESIKKEVIEVFKQGIIALGIKNGTAKGDMKYSSKKGAMVGEIAARLSGGFMSGWTYPYHSGIDLTSAAIKIACGKEPDSLIPKDNKVSAERAAVSIPGQVQSIEGIDKAKGLDHVKDCFIHTKKGERVVFPVNNVQKCANIISVAQNYDEAINSAEQAVRSLFIRLVPNNLETAEFIERKTYAWVPDAFVLTVPENIVAVIKMGQSGFGLLPKIEEEPARDWHGCSLQEAFNNVQNLTICKKTDFTADFWRAFLRGGIQAGVWYLETKK